MLMILLILLLVRVMTAGPEWGSGLPRRPPTTSGCRSRDPLLEMAGEGTASYKIGRSNKYRPADVRAWARARRPTPATPSPSSRDSAHGGSGGRYP